MERSWKSPKNARRIAGDNRARGNIFRDNRAGTNHGAFPNSQSAENGRVAADRNATADHGRFTFPILHSLERAIIIRRAWKPIVDEHHTVPDESLVLDHHARTHERVTLDL